MMGRRTSGCSFLKITHYVEYFLVPCNTVLWYETLGPPHNFKSFHHIFSNEGRLSFIYLLDLSLYSYYL